MNFANDLTTTMFHPEETDREQKNIDYENVAYLILVSMFKVRSYHQDLSRI